MNGTRDLRSALVAGLVKCFRNRGSHVVVPFDGRRRPAALHHGRRSTASKERTPGRFARTVDPDTRLVTANGAGDSAFGTILREFRLAARLSQEQLAERAQLSVESISALERGRRRAPYRDTVKMLADALRLSEPDRLRLTSAAKRSVALNPRVSGLETQPEHNLTRPLNSFRGREEDLRRLTILQAESRLVTIVGAGGMGKTRLALELAWQRRGEYRDGVWFVDLAAVASEAQVRRAVFSTLGLPEPSDSTVDMALVQHLRDRAVLLILDNCEHVLDAVSSLAFKALGHCPTLAILATSREQLEIPGERVYRIGSLAVPPREQIRGAEPRVRSPAVELFLERSAAAGARADLDSDETAQLAAEICRRLEGIPLAIELAATHSASLTFSEMLDQLQRHFGILGSAKRGSLPRHQTMHSTIEWSYNLLSELERAFMRRLALFANGFTLETAGDFCADLLDGMPAVTVVTPLVNKSLIVADPVGSVTRYRFHEPIRAFSLDKLHECGEGAAGTRKLAEWSASFAARTHVLWETASTELWVQTVEPELENLRASAFWALECEGDLALGRRLVSGARRTWARLAPSEGNRWIQMASRGSSDDTAEIRAGLWLAEAHVHIALQRYETALAAATLAQEALDRLGQTLPAAEARGFAGFALTVLGKSDGESLIEEALRVYRAMGARQLTAYAINDLGICRFVRGDLDGARAHYRAAMRLFRHLRNERGYTTVSGNLAEIEFQAGNVELALELANEAVAAAHGRDTCVFLANIAAYLIKLDRWEEARARARESITRAGIARTESDLAMAIQHLAAIEALRPSYPGEQPRAAQERAARLLGFAEGRIEALNTPRQYTDESERARIHDALANRLGADLQTCLDEGRLLNQEDALAEAWTV